MKKGLLFGALVGMGLLVATKAGGATPSGSSGSGSGAATPPTPPSSGGTRSAGPGGPASLPRGIRNNNPGNIRRNAANAWRGKIPFADSTDTAFEQFTTPVMGIRALLVLLRNYIGQGNNTLRKIITKWAPPSENATGVYISFAASALGISPDRAISRDDATLLIRLAKAITQKENGQNPYSHKQFQDAWYYVNNPGIAGIGRIVNSSPPGLDLCKSGKYTTSSGPGRCSNNGGVKEPYQDETELLRVTAQDLKQAQARPLRNERLPIAEFTQAAPKQTQMLFRVMYQRLNFTPEEAAQLAKMAIQEKAYKPEAFVELTQKVFPDKFEPSTVTGLPAHPPGSIEEYLTQWQ